MASVDDKTSPRALRDKADATSDQFGQLKRRCAAWTGRRNRETLASAPFAPLLRKAASYWWVLLLLGVFWLAVSAVVLKFNHASVTTVGILIGIMLLLFAVEESFLAAIDRAARWLWAMFGVLLVAAGIVALIHPTNTFAWFADILGFVFLFIGIMWMVQAFAERPINDLWWLTQISGILMIVLAFWVSGQFFLVRAYTLLIFAGAWALATGILYVVRAFQLYDLRRKLR